MNLKIVSYVGKVHKNLRQFAKKLVNCLWHYTIYYYSQNVQSKNQKIQLNLNVVYQVLNHKGISMLHRLDNNTIWVQALLKLSNKKLCALLLFWKQWRATLVWTLTDIPCCYSQFKWVFVSVCLCVKHLANFNTST